MNDKIDDYSQKMARRSARASALYSLAASLNSRTQSSPHPRHLEQWPIQVEQLATRIASGHRVHYLCNIAPLLWELRCARLSDIAPLIAAVELAFRDDLPTSKN